MSNLRIYKTPCSIAPGRSILQSLNQWFLPDVVGRCVQIPKTGLIVFVYKLEQNWVEFQINLYLEMVFCVDLKYDN
ncbi:hypothetical protein Hanom_Chr04g00339221 [Helianthus anomalus]